MGRLVNSVCVRLQVATICSELTLLPIGLLTPGVAFPRNCWVQLANVSVDDIIPKRFLQDA